MKIFIKLCENTVHYNANSEREKGSNEPLCNISVYSVLYVAKNDSCTMSGFLSFLAFTAAGNYFQSIRFFKIQWKLIFVRNRISEPNIAECGILS